jgi:hypothetical protein
MPPGMVAFHGPPSYRIAGILPALCLPGRPPKVEDPGAEAREQDTNKDIMQIK